MIITIDGPTASGKSTLAKLLAEKLKIYHLNTGLFYRGLAYLLISKFNYNQESLKNPIQKDLNAILDPKKFVYKFDGSNPFLFFEGTDITNHLKNGEIDLYSSIISQNPKVRTALLSFQRNIAKEHDLVIEGRDCGSVVFPEAQLKIFLTADLNVRAKRWQEYMKEKGKVYSLDESVKFVSDRDERDKKRDISPLIVPENATIIDDSNLSKTEVLSEVINLYNKIK